MCLTCISCVFRLHLRRLNFRSWLIRVWLNGASPTKQVITAGALTSGLLSNMRLSMVRWTKTKSNSETLNNKSELTHIISLNYYALLYFYCITGNTDIPTDYPELTIDNVKVNLSAWLIKQKNSHLRNTLKPDRLERLQSLVNEGKIIIHVRTPTFVVVCSSFILLLCIRSF